MVEANYGDGMFNNLLRPVVAERCGQVAIEEYKVLGQKEKRMLESLEPVLAQHRLIIDKKAIMQETLQRQITRLTSSRGALKHDDRVDVLSAAVNFWKDNLNCNVDNVVEKRRDATRKEEVDEWAKNFRAGMAGQLSGALRQSGPSNTNKFHKKENNKWTKKNRRRSY